MALPLLPLLAGAAAIAALAFSGKKDSNAAQGGTAPGQPGSGAPGTFPNPFDRGLSQEQVTAVQTALATETDPTKLEAFAKSLAALGFPLAAAALNGKAAVLRAAQGPNLGLPAPVFAPVATPTFVPVANVVPSAAPPVPAATQAAAQQLAAAIASDPNAAQAAAAQAFGAALVNLEAQEALMGSATVTTPGGGPVNLRVSPPSGNAIGSLANGSKVRIIQPDKNPGAQRSVKDGSLWFMVQQGDAIGWAAGQFLRLNGDANTNPAITSPFGGGAPSGGGPTFAAGLVPGGSGGRVVVTANLLGLRGSPDARAPYVAQATKGSTFVIAGPEIRGYIPLSDDGGNVAWASKLYLAPMGGGNGAPRQASAGLSDVGAGPSVPFADLHMNALALKTALATHGCRSHNEPLVKNFQRAAKAAGIYQGDIDGWYGTVTQAALSQIVGKPAPACFPEAKGGPINPNEYWSPMGV